MMSALLDTTAEIREMELEDDWQPETLPSTLSVITRSWSRAGDKALDLAGFIGKVALGKAHIYSDKRLRKLDSPPQAVDGSVLNIQSADCLAEDILGEEF